MVLPPRLYEHNSLARTVNQMNKIPIQHNGIHHTRVKTRKAAVPSGAALGLAVTREALFAMHDKKVGKNVCTVNRNGMLP